MPCVRQVLEIKPASAQRQTNLFCDKTSSLLQSGSVLQLSEHLAIETRTTVPFNNVWANGKLTFRVLTNGH